MKSRIWAVFILLSFGAERAMAQGYEVVERAPDVGFALQLDIPGRGNFDLYDVGLTGNVEFRGWFNDLLGYGLSIGYGQWSTESGATKPGARLFDYSGDLQVIPLTASLKYALFIDDAWDLILDLGLTYMIVDSDITARNRDQSGTRRFKVDIGDTVQLKPSIGADYHAADNLIWSFALGYRQDISRGSIRTELGPARDNIMESFYFETAIRLAF